MDSLKRKSLIGLIQLQLAMALLIFVPAGSLRFWQGWVFWILFLICVAAITMYFLKHDPHLVEGRLRAGPLAEPERSQKIIQAIAGALFCAVLIVPGLDHRFHWSHVPAPIVALSDLAVVLAFVMMFFVFKENSYAGSIIKVETEQRVISTGLYRVVRHPLYSAGVILFIAIPLALGSAWALLVAIPLCAVVAVRLLHEEQFLCAHLPDYDAYCRQVRYRLVPHVW